MTVIRSSDNTDGCTEISITSSSSSSSTLPRPNNIDEILLKYVKPFGPWQFVVLMISVWSDIPSAIFPIFGNAIPENYRCRMESNIEEMFLANSSINQISKPGFLSPKGPLGMLGIAYNHRFEDIAAAISPIRNGTPTSRCFRYKRNYEQVKDMADLMATPKSTPLEPCPLGYVYDASKYQYPSGIVIEWDLVCDREWLVSLSEMMYMFGMVPGFWIGGMIADSIGRRPTALGILFFQVITGVLCSFAPNIEVFVMGRFCLAFLTVARSNVLLVLPAELTTSKYRYLVAATTCFVQSFLNRALVALCAYLIPYWRWLHLTTVSPLVIGILHISMLPESPRWLLAKERYDEAAEVLYRGYLFNQRGWCWYSKNRDDDLVSADFFHSIFAEEAAESTRRREDTSAPPNTTKNCCRFLGGLRNPYRTAKLARISLISTFLFTSQSACLFGVLLYARVIRSYVYLVAFINNLTGIPGSILCAVLYSRIRHRKRPLMLTYFCTFVCLLIGGIYGWLNPNGDDLVLNICSNLGLVLCSAITNMLLTYIPELYPSCIRSQGLGTAAGLGRIGAALGTFINDLDVKLFHGVPLVFYSGLLLFALIALVFLPDTTGDNLRDKIEDDD